MTTPHTLQPKSAFIVGPIGDRLRTHAPIVLTLLTELEAHLTDFFPFTSPVWCAGGAVRAMLFGDKPRDVDLWFPCSRLLNDATNVLQSEHDHKIICTNDLVTKLSVLVADHSWVNVDLVRRPFSSPLECSRHMDFVSCSAAVDLRTYVRHEAFEEDARAHVLRINAPWRPRASLRRADRFVEVGWTMSDAERATLTAMAEDPCLPKYDFTDDAKSDVGDYG